MKILIAGASGAIGQPLVDEMIYYGHEVFGITRSEESAQLLAAKGAKPILLDIFQKEAVAKTVSSIRPDTIVDMLTSLPKEYTTEAMRDAAESDAKVRREGGQFLQEAAESHGVKRYIVQSSAFWYAPGSGLANEETSFAIDATPAISAGTRLYKEIEKRVLLSSKLEGVSLRFGFFYGPGTWFDAKGSAARQVIDKAFPVIGRGQGIWSFVHIQDAAKAAAASLYCSPGAYNIVNNSPAPMRDWLPAFARYLGAPQPPFISEEEGLLTRGPEAVYYATKLRGASNSKAKEALNFSPSTFEWML